MTSESSFLNANFYPGFKIETLFFFFIQRQDINDSTKIRLILIRMSVIISEYITFFFEILHASLAIIAGVISYIDIVCPHG